MQLASPRPTPPNSSCSQYRMYTARVDSQSFSEQPGNKAKFKQAMCMTKSTTSWMFTPTCCLYMDLRSWISSFSSSVSSALSPYICSRASWWCCTSYECGYMERGQMWAYEHVCGYVSVYGCMRVGGWVCMNVCGYMGEQFIESKANILTNMNTLSSWVYYWTGCEWSMVVSCCWLVASP